ncbi:MAG TPA: hypothetical protein PL029_06515, partial [Bacteroidia bacterium]|nr:hypothetical protein [Bacteroidia bacterium]
MKLQIKFIIAIILLSGVFPGELLAQSDIRASYIFSADSVSGFDETNSSMEALAHGCFGAEYKAFLYIQKRNFIKQKYNLQPTLVTPLTLFQNQQALRTTAIGGACDNEDFELATTQINAPGLVQGWTVQSGNNPNSCAPPNLTGTGFYTVFVGPTIDPKLGFQVSSYFDAGTNVVQAGSAFIRL